MEFSTRIVERSQSPNFLLDTEKASDFLKDLTSEKFFYNFEVANSNGLIKIFGRVDQSNIVEINYSTNIKEVALGFLDALIELIKGRNIIALSGLSMREVESFLRDQNHIPSIPSESMIFHRIFSLVSGFQSYLSDRFIDRDSLNPSYDGRL